MKQPNLTIYFSRFCVATTFYGISFNITGFGLNIYLTQLVYALIELPTKITVYYLLDMIGRRSSIVGSLMMSGICLGINILIPEGKDACEGSEVGTRPEGNVDLFVWGLFSDMSVARTVVAIFGKAFSSASFTILILYSSELFPTVVR